MKTLVPAKRESENRESQNVTPEIAELIFGVPLPRETLILFALKRIYLSRTDIVEKVALDRRPCFIGEAQSLVHALAIIESILDEAGLLTELSQNPAHFPSERPSYLQVVNDVLNSESVTPDGDPERDCVIAQVNRAFRPWIKPPKGRSKTLGK